MGDTEFAKTHLRDHLASILVPRVSEGFWSIESSAADLCKRNGTPDQVIRTFQNMLTKIPEWSDHTLTTEVERIQKVSKCGYLDDLIMGVFIAYMKSFANLHYSGERADIQIDFDRPTLAKFIHELYIHCARKLWQTAYLFKTSGVTSEMQARCRSEIDASITQCLDQVINSFLPWETITKKYFAGESQAVPPPPPSSPEQEEKKGVTFEEEEEEEEEEEAPPKLEIGEEDATIEVEGEEEDEEKEEDVVKELEKKVEETLVLNL